MQYKGPGRLPRRSADGESFHAFVQQWDEEASERVTQIRHYSMDGDELEPDITSVPVPAFHSTGAHHVFKSDDDEGNYGIFVFDVGLQEYQFLAPVKKPGPSWAIGRSGITCGHQTVRRSRISPPTSIPSTRTRAVLTKQRMTRRRHPMKFSRSSATGCCSNRERHSPAICGATFRNPRQGGRAAPVDGRRFRRAQYRLVARRPGNRVCQRPERGPGRHSWKRLVDRERGRRGGPPVDRDRRPDFDPGTRLTGGGLLFWARIGR